MASFNITANIRMIPDDETMNLILQLLDLWQDANPNLMIGMVPDRDRYVYEIIERKKEANYEYE